MNFNFSVIFLKSFASFCLNISAVWFSVVFITPSFNKIFSSFFIIDILGKIVVSALFFIINVGLEEIIAKRNE